MLTDAYHLISRWSNHPRNIMNLIGTSNDGLTFSHTVTPIPCCDCTTVTCLNCQRIGHFNYECPDRQSSSPSRASATTSVPSEEGKLLCKIPQETLDSTNLNLGYHSDSDTDSNLELWFLVNNFLIPSSWIPLNNQSDVVVFHNP